MALITSDFVGCLGAVLAVLRGAARDRHSRLRGLCARAAAGLPLISESPLGTSS